MFLILVFVFSLEFYALQDREGKPTTDDEELDLLLSSAFDPSRPTAVSVQNRGKSWYIWHLFVSSDYHL